MITRTRGTKAEGLERQNTQLEQLRHHGVGVMMVLYVIV